MEYLKLLSGGVKAIIRLPVTLINAIFKFKTFRGSVDWVVGESGIEAQHLSDRQKFLRRVGRFLYYLFLFVLIAAALVGLWYLNRYLDLERQLGGPFPELRAYWLPILLGLLVLAGFTAFYLLRLLGPLAEPTDFDDIHRAWADARADIEAAGIRLQEAPLFLILGRPVGGGGAVIAGSRIAFPIRGVPDRADSPIRVFANAVGVYVSCPGVGLLSELATRLAAEGGPEIPAPSAARTVFEDDAAKELAPTVAAADAPLLLPDDAPKPSRPAAPTRDRPTPQLLADADAVNRCADRVRYLGRLLAFHREPYCGANGIILLVPASGLTGDAVADQSAGAAAADLASIRDGLGVDCPTMVLAGDLETLPGADVFLRQLPDDRKDRLMGLPFPPVTDLPADRLAPAAADGVRWTGGAIERMLVRSVSVGDRSPVVELAANTALYRFLAAVRSILPRLERVASRVAVPDGRPARYAGGFLAATGSDPATGQAFLAGVFRLLTDHQNAVRWTAAARSGDAAYRTWTMVGYLLTGAFLLAVGYWCYREWW